MWEEGGEERTIYMYICLYAHIGAPGGNQFMAAVSGEGKSDTGVWESGGLLCVPHPFVFLDFVPFAHDSYSKYADK